MEYRLVRSLQRGGESKGLQGFTGQNTYGCLVIRLYCTVLHDWKHLKKDKHVQFSNSGGHRRELLWKNW